jgi:peroxiredoxin
MAAIRGKGPAYGLEPGRCLPDFEFVTVEGVRRQLSDFKGRNNVVVILPGADRTLLDALARDHPSLENLEAHVIAILTAFPFPATARNLFTWNITDFPRPASSTTRRSLPARSTPWPFDVAVDSDGVLYRMLGARDARGAGGMAIYVTDRWAEVKFACRTLQGDPLPGAQDILEWLAFVDHECPECFPSEWPS